MNNLETLEQLRHAAGVSIEEIAHIIGCSHFTYKKLRSGDTRIEDWSERLESAQKVLDLGFRARVLPTVNVGRREQILDLLLRAHTAPAAEVRGLLEQAMNLAMQY